MAWSHRGVNSETTRGWLIVTRLIFSLVVVFSRALFWNKLRSIFPRVSSLFATQIMAVSFSLEELEKRVNEHLIPAYWTNLNHIPVTSYGIGKELSGNTAARDILKHEKGTLPEHVIIFETIWMLEGFRPSEIYLWTDNAYEISSTVRLATVSNEVLREMMQPFADYGTLLKRIYAFVEKTQQTDRQTNTNGLTDTDRQTNTNGLTDTNRQTNTNGLTDTDRQTYTNGLTDTDRQTYTNGLTDTILEFVECLQEFCENVRELLVFIRSDVKKSLLQGMPYGILSLLQQFHEIFQDLDFIESIFCEIEIENFSTKKQNRFFEHLLLEVIRCKFEKVSSGDVCNYGKVVWRILFLVCRRHGDLHYLSHADMLGTRNYSDLIRHITAVNNEAVFKKHSLNSAALPTAPPGGEHPLLHLHFAALRQPHAPPK